MSDIVLHEESYGCLLMAPEVPCIIISWKGFANSEQFRSLMDRGLEFYIAEAAHNSPLGWLADTRVVSAVKEADQIWMKTDWNLRACQAGIRHVSFVVPETVFGQISVQSYSTNSTQAVDYKITPTQHKTLKEAKSWLKKAIH